MEKTTEVKEDFARIKPLKSEDIERVIPALKEYAEEMNYPFNEEHVRKTLLSAMADGKYPFFIAEEDGEIVGMCACIVAPHILDPNQWHVYEYLWHSKPSLSPYKRAKLMIDLLDVMEAGPSKNGFPLHISVNWGNAQVTGLLEGRGYKPIEHHYVREDW